MKQNLQPPATPLEMLSLFFPAGLLDYFDLVNHVSQETCFIFFLEEKPSIPQEHIVCSLKKFHYLCNRKQEIMVP